MKLNNKILKLKIIVLLSFFSVSVTLADNHNIYENLEQIQKDLKTLEKAVYSGSIDLNNNSSSMSMSNNSEDVLTRHLLKLSEIESQFQQLTNKFEEINFKLDKLSNRLSKVQADNQIRFQDIEKAITLEDGEIKITKKSDDNNVLPGSSEPQDLGSISYQDNNTNEISSQINMLSYDTQYFNRVLTISRFLSHYTPKEINLSGINFSLGWEELVRRKKGRVFKNVIKKTDDNVRILRLAGFAKANQAIVQRHFDNYVESLEASGLFQIVEVMEEEITSVDNGKLNFVLKCII